jgi:hypothetical protein
MSGEQNMPRLGNFRNISFSDMRNEEIVDSNGKAHIYPFALKDSPYYKFLKAFTRHMSNKIPSSGNINNEKIYGFIRDNYRKFMEDFPDRDLLELASGGADPSHWNKIPFENIFFKIPDNGYIPNRSDDPINVLNESPSIAGRNIVGGRHRAIYMKYLADLYSKNNLNRFEKALLWKIKSRYGNNFLPDNTLEVHEDDQYPMYETYPIYNPKEPILGAAILPMARYIRNDNMTHAMRVRKGWPKPSATGHKIEGREL